MTENGRYAHLRCESSDVNRTELRELLTARFIGLARRVTRPALPALDEGSVWISFSALQRAYQIG